jgi:hypothetical protein
MNLDEFRKHLKVVDPAMLAVDDVLTLIDLLSRCFARRECDSAPLDGPAK